MKHRILPILILMVLLCPAAYAQGNETIIAPSGLYLQKDGNLLFTDLYQKAIWTQSPNGEKTILAGGGGAMDAAGVPIGGYADGSAQSALFRTPWAIAPYGNGWAISDTDNHVIRLLANGKVSTIAGTAFSSPTGLAAGPDGSLFVADTGNHLIQKIDKQGNITTYAGSVAGCTDGTVEEARFEEPTGLYYADGILYVADSGNHRICTIQKDRVITLAGGLSGEEDYVDGRAERARFSNPQGLIAQADTVFVADTGNGAIRAITDGRVRTIYQEKDSPNQLYPVSPRGMVAEGGTLTIGDFFAHTLFSVPLTQETAVPVFPDVETGSWYAEGVTEIVNRGLMGDAEGGLFRPKAELNRGMCVTILARIQQKAFPNTIIAGTSAFPDVSGKEYYAAAAAWAANQGIAEGIEGNFMARRPITRAELVTFFYRYAPLAGLEREKTSDLSHYADSETIPVWAEPAFAWAAENALIKGTDEGELRPFAHANRAEMALILLRFINLAEF